MLAPLLAAGLDDHHTASAAEGGIGSSMVSLSRRPRRDNVEISSAFGKQSCWRPGRGATWGPVSEEVEVLGSDPWTQITDLPARTPAIFPAGNEVTKPMSGPILGLHSGGLPLVGYRP